MKKFSELLIKQIFYGKLVGTENIIYTQTDLTKEFKDAITPYLNKMEGIDQVEGGIKWFVDQASPTYVINNNRLEFEFYFGSKNDNLSQFTVTMFFNKDGKIEFGEGIIEL